MADFTKISARNINGNASIPEGPEGLTHRGFPWRDGHFRAAIEGVNRKTENSFLGLLKPVRMEHPRLVHALVRVRAKEVPLRL